MTRLSSAIAKGHPAIACFIAGGDKNAVAKVAPTISNNAIIATNICGHGDKNIFTVAEALGEEI